MYAMEKGTLHYSSALVGPSLAKSLLFLKFMKLSDASACITEPRPLECFHASLTLLWKMSETFKIDGPNLGASGR